MRVELRRRMECRKWQFSCRGIQPEQRSWSPRVPQPNSQWRKKRQVYKIGPAGQSFKNTGTKKRDGMQLANSKKTREKSRDKDGTHMCPQTLPSIPQILCKVSVEYAMVLFRVYPRPSLVNPKWNERHAPFFARLIGPRDQTRRVRIACAGKAAWVHS